LFQILFPHLRRRLPGFVFLWKTLYKNVYVHLISPTPAAYL
jgi:hypothetical protein